MRKINWIIVGLSGLAIFLLTMKASLFKRAADLIIKFEGFRANPYWDVSRYSWGYGTKAPGQTGTITKAKAFTDLVAHVGRDYNYLKPFLRRDLTANQWAALLSFSYNLGPGNAANLVENINSGDDYELGVQWGKYINAGGVPNDNLKRRREDELRMWNS
jgi:lysozyme